MNFEANCNVLQNSCVFIVFTNKQHEKFKITIVYFRAGVRMCASVCVADVFSILFFFLK